MARTPCHDRRAPSFGTFRGLVFAQCTLHGLTMLRLKVLVDQVG